MANFHRHGACFSIHGSQGKERTKSSAISTTLALAFTNALMLDVTSSATIRRPKDTEAELLPKKKKKKPGVRGKSKVPSANAFFDCRFGISWSYKNLSMEEVTNTCAMDSVLMLLYVLRKYSDVPRHIFDEDEVLTEVLNQIDMRQFDDARM